MDRLISTYILAQTDSQEQADAAIQDIVKGTHTQQQTLVLFSFSYALPVPFLF
jgi:hypothetical protein